MVVKSINVGKRLLTLLLAVIAVGITSIDANACLYPYEDEEGRDEVKLTEDNDIRFWWQGRVPADNSAICPGGSGIGEAGCSHFAMSYALVKMGIFNVKNGDSPITQIENARKSNAFLTSWGYYDFSKSEEMYSGIKYLGWDTDVAGLGSEEAITYIKGLLAKGKYIVGIVNGPMGGHCIFFDGVNDDGTVSIGDSAFNGLTWDVTYGAMGATFQYLEVMEYTIPSNEQPSIYDDTALRNNPEEDVKDIENFNTLVEEWGLTGMPSKSSLSEKVVLDNLVLPQRYELTKSELSSLEAIQESRDAGKVSILKIISVGFSLLGIVLIVYAVLLMLLYLFDEVSPFDISLVGVLTLGHIKIVSSEYLSEYGSQGYNKGYFSNKKLFVVILVIFVIGVMMVSGVLYKILLRGLNLL